MERASGILMPMSSLPSPYGIGTMGEEAYRFIDFLAAAGQKYWQLLPLGPTAYGDSPYASPSSYAGNPYYIDLDLLIEEGLLTREDAEAAFFGSDPQRVDYGALYGNRFTLLRKAFIAGRERYGAEIAAFRMENARWLESYALFMALKERFAMRPWQQWPEDIRLRQPEALPRYALACEEEIAFWVFTQFCFFRQWNALRAYAREKGIGFIGDIPIYVAPDSADIWSEPEYFLLDENRMCREVSGVPPDGFTADGQLWGNPLYDWERLKQDGYGWWIRRVEGAARLFDVLRIDHFRGLESYWAVPAGEKTARNGRWCPGPGIDFVRTLTGWFPNLSFIAEDLGYLTPEVETLLKESGLPGMKVLHWAFDADGDSDYMPHHIEENSVCYVGTHDNDTILGWVETTPEEDKAFAREYARIGKEEGWCFGLIRVGMSTASRLFVAQMQDVLELGPACRMNRPGIAEGNWQWRMLPGAATGERAARLRHLTELYKRL